MQDIRQKWSIDNEDIKVTARLIDELSDKDRELVSSIGKVTSAAKAQGDAMAKGPRAGLAGLTSFTKKTEDTAKATAKLRDEFGRFVKSSEEGGKKLGKSFDSAAKSAQPLDGALSGLQNKIVALFAVDQILGFGKQVIDITSQFQKLDAVLTNALGSDSAGAVAFAKIQDSAAKSNFSVLELTESYVKLVNSGFEPTTAELTRLQDVANSTGKSFDQLTEAIIDAQTGEFERLKEFGIRASKEGDKVTFTFKGVQTQVNFTNEAIRNYITGLGDLQGVSGSTAAISATLEGKISNLGDATDRLLSTLGNAGSAGFGQFLDFITAAVNGIEKLIAGEEELIKREGLRQQAQVAENYAKNVAQLAESYVQLGFSVSEANKKAQEFFERNAGQSLTELYNNLRAVETQIENLIETSGADIASPFNLLIESDAKKQFNLLQKQKAEIQAQIGVQRQYLDSQDKINIEAKKTVQLTADQIKELEKAKKALEDLRKEYEKIVESARDVLRSDLDKIIIEFEKTTARLNEIGLKIGVDKEKLAADLKIVTDAFEKQFRDALDKIGVIEELVPPEKTKEQLEKEKKLREKYIDDRIKKTIDATEQELDILRAQAEEEAKIWKEKEKLKQQIAQESFVLFGDLGNALFELQNARYQSDLEQTQQTEQSKLAIVGDNEQAQQFIREESDRKQREIKLRQARADRNAALFNIALSTAQGVASVLSTGGGTRYADFGVAAATLSAIVLAQGLVQAGLVLAKPLPQFRSGVINLQGPGSETSDSIMARLSKGESVMTAAETRDFMPSLLAIRKKQVAPELMNAMATGKLPKGVVSQSEDYRALQREYMQLSSRHDSLLSEVKGLRRDLAGKESYQLNLDENGFKKYMRKGNATIEFLNNQFPK